MGDKHLNGKPHTIDDDNWWLVVRNPEGHLFCLFHAYPLDTQGR